MNFEAVTFLTRAVETNSPAIFAKFGDGEHTCMASPGNHNCDGDPQSFQLSQALKTALVHLVNHDAFIGRWHNDQTPEYLQTLTDKPIRWANYHTLIFDRQRDWEKRELLQKVQKSSATKTLVANRLLIKATKVLHCQTMVEVPFRGWFSDQFEQVLEEVLRSMGSQAIVVTCCGMGAKVLISQLVKRRPDAIYLDYGSGLDFLCTKQDSRGREYAYPYLTSLLAELLPPDWENPEYETIYREAKRELGIHL